METENSRRILDRSREPGLKKPRLDQDPTLSLDRSSNGRATFMQRPAAPGSASSRRVSERGGDSEKNDSVRGLYPQSQHPHVELVNQYKTALAELTFNSKPIITNLTIIAGESLHAAKGIAATICSNILEVPSEQKLSSFYLLDSIVKNIGRDYIKYFGSRLPEVFCKAYRHVDPSLHQGMRHLFGTWKGVFPPQPLQAIEKELGFVAAVNKLPSGTSPRPDAPASRPAHSIHVNPKYLEARQRLQQSSKTKVAGDDFSENVVNSTTDLGGQERTSFGSGRPRIGDSKSSQHTQREGSDVLRTKSFSAPFGENENDSDTSKQSGLEITRGDEKFSGNVRGTVSTQRNGFGRKHGIQNYPLNTKRVPNHGLTSQSTIPMTGSWKNSEEEEYMWDDMNLRVGDHDHEATATRDHWSLDNSEKMSEASADSLSTEMNDQAIFGSRGSSPWSQELPLPDRVKSFAGRTIPGLSESYTVSGGGLSTSSTNGRTSFQSKVAPASIGSSVYGSSNSLTLGSAVSMAPQRQTVGVAPPSAQSLLYPRDSLSSFRGHGVLSVPLHITTEKDEPQARIHAEPRSSQFSGSQNIDPRTKLGQESSQFPSRNIHLPNQRVQSPNIPSSISATPQLKQPTSFAQHLEPEPLAPDLSHQAQEPFSRALSSTCPLSDDPDPLPLPYSGQSSTNDLLAAISGILNGNSIAVRFSHQSSQTSDALTSQANTLPPIPSGPTQTQFTPSTLGGVAMASLSTSQGVKSTLPSKRSFDGHPLPAGSVTTNLSSSTLAQSANVTNANTPVSSLLSSLVAKGLISASKTESTSNTSYTPAQPQKHSPETTRSGSSQVPEPLASLPISSSYTVNEPSSAKPISTSTELSLGDQAEMISHIGFQFKGDVLRVLHPAVISRLFDDFPHKCGVCEGRVKLQDQVARHLEWHALRNGKSNSNKASRVWYADSISMLAADAGTVSVDEPSGPQEVLVKRPECTEPMVPADESQCLCILCGELFKDFYDQGMAQWMFKGAVYANVPCSDATTGNQSEVGQDSIVHEKCISKIDS